MASVKKTSVGWKAVNEVTGNVIQGQPREGFETRRAAKEWAARNLSAVSTASEVDTF